MFAICMQIEKWTFQESNHVSLWHGRIQRIGCGMFWPMGPNLPPFWTLSTDLGHFILKLLNFDVIFVFYLYFFYIYLVVLGTKTYPQSVLWPRGPLDPPIVFGVKNDKRGPQKNIFLTRARPGVWATFARPGGTYVPPRLTRKLRNASTSGKKHSIGLNKL